MFWQSPDSATANSKAIARARKNVALYERWGRWLTALYTVIAILGLAVLIMLGNLMAHLGNNLAANRLDLWVGFVLGVIGGSLLFKTSHTFAQAWISRWPDRRDRLLVEYHDALSEVVGDRAKATSEPGRAGAERPHS